jgi:hypothetical protein
VGHTRVAPEYAPNYVRASTCPCPAKSTESTRVAPSHTRRIRCTVGLRLHAGSAPTSCQGYNQVTHGLNAGYALVTPWSRPGNQATPGAPRGHTRVTRQSSTSHARHTPGHSLVTPGRPPEHTRVTPESPGVARGPGLYPMEKQQATHQVTPRGHPSDTQMAPVKPRLHQGHSEVTSKLRQVTPG